MPRLEIQYTFTLNESRNSIVYTSIITIAFVKDLNSLMHMMYVSFFLEVIVCEICGANHVPKDLTNIL